MQSLNNAGAVQIANGEQRLQLESLLPTISPLENCKLITTEKWWLLNKVDDWVDGDDL